MTPIPKLVLEFPKDFGTHQNHPISRTITHYAGKKLRILRLHVQPDGELVSLTIERDTGETLIVSGDFFRRHHLTVLTEEEEDG